MADISHASDTAFWDVCRVASRPFVASHSNCRAVQFAAQPHRRDDPRLGRAWRRQGINLCSGFLSQSYYDQETPAREAF